MDSYVLLPARRASARRAFRFAAGRVRLHRIFPADARHRLLIGALLAAVSISASAETWTLESAARRVLEVAPETRAADADVGVREAELTRDTAWPNPTVGGRADRKLGIENGRGGTDLTQLAITQPLPVVRLPRQRAQAEANLAAARAARRYQRLVLENQAARAFHELQFAAANQHLARERLDTAQQYGAPGRAGDRLVRYLTPLERTRLAILRESARQAAVAAEGAYREAAARFRRLLALPVDTAPVTAPLAAVASPAPPLADLAAGLDAHPALVASQREVDAARAGIGVARVSRYADPTVSLFRERDNLGGSRRDFSGVMLGVQIPLWNLNRGPVDRAAAEASRAAATRDARRRDLEIALRDAHLRLARLIEQAEQQSANVLQPSRRFLDLARRSFAAGETNVLALLDANNSYFDAAQQHIVLLVESQLAAADLRLAAGESLLAGKEVSP